MSVYPFKRSVGLSLGVVLGLGVLLGVGEILPANAQEGQDADPAATDADRDRSSSRVQLTINDDDIMDIRINTD